MYAAPNPFLLNKICLIQSSIILTLISPMNCATMCVPSCGHVTASAAIHLAMDWKACLCTARPVLERLAPLPPDDWYTGSVSN